MAVWTQSTVEGHRDHRIVFSKSMDKGRSWAAPEFVVGVKAGEFGSMRFPVGGWKRPERNKGLQASWGFPVLSKSGRIYIIYNQYQGVEDLLDEFTGTMDAVCSDDNGGTWSAPQTIPMKRSPWDHPNPKVPSNWIVWQRPQRDLQGRWFVGFTRWLSKAVRTSPAGIVDYRTDAVIEFMRFENIDENPDPRNIRISWFAFGDKALKVPHPNQPSLSCAEEPSIVRLPDNRLFCTMRTKRNCVWWSVSSDDGETWAAPRPLLNHDHGTPMHSPVFCTPIYRIADGRYILIHHPAYMIPKLQKQYHVNVEHVKNRRPAFIALGEFRPNAEQPIWFSQSRMFMDNDGVGMGPRAKVDIGGYCSLTTLDGENILWHPDRKFFLLGKRVTSDFLAGLKVPTPAERAPRVESKFDSGIST